MMRFRVFAWLAALVVLAGCVESNVEESISRAADGLVVEHSCESYSFGQVESYSYLKFGIFAESNGFYPLRNSTLTARVFLQYRQYSDPHPCTYTVTSAVTTLNTASGFQLSEISSLLPLEQAIFDEELARCKALGPNASRRYERETFIYMLGTGAFDLHRFIGCEALIRKYSTGVVAANSDGKYRIVLILDQLITTRINN